MLTVPQYTQHIRETVFTEALQKLEQCADAESVSNWKKVVCGYICEKKVAGEPAREPINFGLNPQDEERKENLSMPQRIYYEALQL
jgi:hypothetical protein